TPSPTGQPPQYQTSTAFTAVRSVTRVGSQLTMRFHPKRDALKAPKRAESLDGAANVPRAHPVQRLSEQHETPANLRLFLRVTAPRRRADAARRDVNENRVVGCKCAAKEVELFRACFEKRSSLRRIRFHLIRKRVT